MDTLFFIASKVVWFIIRPESWIVLGLGTVLVALLKDRRRLAVSSIIATMGFVVLIGVVPFGHLIIRPLERVYPPAPNLEAVDGIIVLGGAESPLASRLSGQPEFNEAGERLAVAAALGRRFPESRILLTGGSGALRDIGRTVENATLAERFFLDQGFPATRLIIESASRNTAENASMSLPLVDPGAGETWLLVTSAWHMPRAMQTFAAAKWPPLVAYPVDFRSVSLGDGLGWNIAENLGVLNIAMREYVGRLAYSLTNR